LKDEAGCLLRMDKISKSFPGVVALDEVDFDLSTGEVHALIGENGAGKSTLIKILSGIEKMDSGKIILSGKEIEITDARIAGKFGIACIHQELNYVPALTVGENILLGHKFPIKAGRRIDWSELNSRSREILKTVGGDHINPASSMKTLSPADIQIVMVANALSQKARIIIMDEPTSSLTSHEIERLFVMIRQLRNDGVSFIYISHRLDETFSLSDRITVLRNGRYVETLPTKAATKDRLITSMIGKSVSEKYIKRERLIAEETLFEIRNFCGGPINDVSFAVRKREIFGIIGLVGAGRTELARMIFGIDKREKGRVLLHDIEIREDSVNNIIEHGICLVPEDRKTQGLILQHDIRRNITYPILNHYKNRITRKVDVNRESEDSEKAITTLSIKATGVGQKADTLSGGNQQKVVISKWLNAHAKVIIFDEPTKGIDVGAKTDLYLLLENLAEEGTGIIFISSEIPEILGICDRVLVLHEGSNMGIEEVDGLSQDKLLHMMFGEDY